jgi:hypothetical protein
MLMALVGLVALAYFLVVYNPAVPETDLLGELRGSRGNYLERLQDRSLGITVGVGLLIAGVVAEGVGIFLATATQQDEGQRRPPHNPYRPPP